MLRSPRQAIAPVELTELLFHLLLRQKVEPKGDHPGSSPGQAYKVQPLGYPTGSTHQHAERLAPTYGRQAH